MAVSISTKQQVFRSMASHVNVYIQSKESKDFAKIEILLRHFFDASNIKIWYCDRDSRALREFGQKDAHTLVMDMSLTEKVIESKKTLIENHITSNKYFNVSIDNPLELKVKSLLMFPLIRHKKVIGIVRIWRGMKQRNNFSKKDEESLVFFQPLFLALIESTSIGKELLLSIVGKDSVQKKIVVIEEKNPLAKKEIVSKTKVKKDKVTLKESPFEILEKKHLELREEKVHQEEVFKKEQKDSISIQNENMKRLDEESKAYKVEIEKFKEEIKRMHSQSEEQSNDFEKQIESSNLAMEEEEKNAKESIKIKNKEIKELGEALTAMNIEISKNDHILENIQKELLSAIQRYQKSEATALKSKKNIGKEQQIVEELEEEVQALKSENKVLNKRIEKLKISEPPISIRALKSQKMQDSKTTSIFSNDKVEYLLEHFDKDFKENMFTYICFELIVYALSSKKGMSDIEEILKRSKVLAEIIDLYYFKGDLIVNNERNSISKLVKHIEGYESSSFANKMKVHINIDKEMPSSLVFDRIKIQSILLHLLNDLYQCAEGNSDITVGLSFQDKYLHIELGTVTYQKSTLLTTMFKQNKLALDNKDRVGLQLSRKIIERLKGKISFSYKNTYYKFILTLPVQVIKL